MRRLLLFVAALSIAVAGCECASTPVHPSCHSSTECHGGQVCVDSRCTAPMDAGPNDAGSGIDAFADDARTPIDAARVDANCIPVTCSDTESCFDGVDDDCDSHVDEGCGCIPGSTARCLPGRPDPSTPRCSWGEMTCMGVGEFGAWGDCTGGGGLDGGMSLYGCRRIGIMGAPGALASSNFQAWLEMQGAIVTRFHDTASAPVLHIEELETFDLVVIDWLQRTYTTEEADVLTTWVNQGGGLISMTGHDSGATADRQISLLATLGPNYERRLCSAGCDADEVCDGGICVLNGPAVLVAHPTTLAADGTTTLPPVTFNGGLPVIVPASMSATFVTMATIGSHVVGAAGPIGMGHALIFGDEWIEFDSEWSTMPPIPRFWQNSVEWCSPDPMVLPACP
jgi:hypothetical protein